MGWVDPWVGLGWVASSTEKVLKIRRDYVNAFKARLDKIWFHRAVKFDFTADLTGTGNGMYKNTSLPNCKLHC